MKFRQLLTDEPAVDGNIESYRFKGVQYHFEGLEDR